VFENAYPCWFCQCDSPLSAVDCPACGAPQLETRSRTGAAARVGRINEMAPGRVEIRRGRVLSVR